MICTNKKNAFHLLFWQIWHSKILKHRVESWTCLESWDYHCKVCDTWFIHKCKGIKN